MMSLGLLQFMAYILAIHGQLNITEKVRITELLLEICPHTPICRNNVSTNEQDNSCCSACSCEEDCGWNVPCCFTENRHVLVDRGRAECLLLQSKQTNTDYLPMYYMRDSVVSTMDDGFAVLGGHCKYVNVAPWGRVFPVTSNSSGYIYINSVCAETDSVTDFQTSEAIVHCETDEDVNKSYRSIAGYVDWPDSCMVYFDIDTNKFASEECYLTDVSTCPKTFRVPPYTNLSRQQIYEGCKSGLIAPYRGFKLVANPFCMMCAGIKKSGICRQVPVRGEGWTFSYTLDFTPAVRRMWASPSTNNTNFVDEACLPATKDVDNNETLCLEAYCPLGQVRSKEDGQCFYPAKVWSTNGFALYLKLMPEDTIVVTLNDSIDGQLESPWPISWTITQMFTKFLDGNSSDDALDVSTNITVIHHIVVRLDTNQTDVNPSYFIKSLERLINTSWIFISSSGPVTLQSSLSKFRAWKTLIGNELYASPSPFADIPLLDLKSSIVLSVIYDFTEYRKSANISSYFITRFHFCESIEHSTQERHLLYESSLYSTLFNRFFHDGEYMFTSNPQGQLRIYICLSDYKFVDIDDVINNIANIETTTDDELRPTSHGSIIWIESMYVLLFFVMSISFCHICWVNPLGI